MCCSRAPSVAISVDRVLDTDVELPETESRVSCAVEVVTCHERSALRAFSRSHRDCSSFVLEVWSLSHSS